MMTKTKDDRLLPMSKITNIFHGENVDDANNARIHLVGKIIFFF